MEGFEFLALPEKYNGVDIINYQYFHNLLNKRTVIFNGEVSEDIVETVILPLKDFEEDTSMEPVTLIIQSPGGSVADGMVLMNIIDNYTKPLKILVYGYAYSMGFAILCSGSKNKNVIKSCHRFTTALWHSGMVFLSGDASAVGDIQDFNKQIDAKLKEYILENTFIPQELYEKKERHQFYFTAEELLRYGIIDEIIGEAKINSLCKECLLKRECENRLDCAFENNENFSCEDFELDA